MGIKGYKCKECEFETTRRGWKNAAMEIQNHFSEHHKEIENKIEDSKQKQQIEINKVEKKYPLITLGRFIKSISSTPAKKWMCPRCKEKMSYGEKYYHQQNAFRRGEEYKCIIPPNN